MSKKKVLVVCQQLNIGGAQKALLSALDHIDYKKNEVTLYIRKRRLELLPHVNSQVAKVIINQNPERYYRKPYSAFCTLMIWLFDLCQCRTEKWEKRLRDYIVRTQMIYEKQHYFSDGTLYDVVVCYVHGYPALLTAKCIDATKKVLFYHGSTDELREINEITFGDFSEIYCVSSYAQKELQRFYPEFRERIGCIENIADAETIREKAEEKTIESDWQKGFTLCTCGRMVKVKGFGLAVEAARILKNQGIQFHWIFVGDGPERSQLEEKIASCELCDVIHITGMRENPYPYIKGSDIYVQPSYEESQCLAIMEAQVLCRPVVSTMTAGGKSLIQNGKNGLLTEITAKALADGILRLIENPSLRQSMEANLSNINYDEKEHVFTEQWAKLLGDK